MSSEIDRDGRVLMGIESLQHRLLGKSARAPPGTSKTLPGTAAAGPPPRPGVVTLRVFACLLRENSAERAAYAVAGSEVNGLPSRYLSSRAPLEPRLRGESKSRDPCAARDREFIGVLRLRKTLRERSVPALRMTRRTVTLTSFPAISFLTFFSTYRARSTPTSPERIGSSFSTLKIPW